MTTIMGLIGLSIIGLFVWAIIKSKIDEHRLAKEHIDINYPSFGEYTSRLEFSKSLVEKDVVLSNTNTGKILIGGKIYNMSEITKCDSKTNQGGMLTTYEDKTYVKTNTGSAIGRAVVGGVIAGGVGAVVGASTATKEIKTEKVRKDTYVPKSYELYLEVNKVRIMFPPEAKSELEIWEVASFINSEIAEYKKNHAK